MILSDLLFGASAGREPLGVYLQSARLRAQSHHALYHETQEFFDPLRFVRGDLYRSRLAGGGHRKPDPVRMDTAGNCRQRQIIYICACSRMTTRRFTFTNQTKLAGCAPPVRYLAFMVAEYHWENALSSWMAMSDAIPVKEAARQALKR
ncbi:hypothetical protein ACLB1R_31470 [Escherichia coli]